MTTKLHPALVRLYAQRNDTRARLLRTYPITVDANGNIVTVKWSPPTEERRILRARLDGINWQIRQWISMERGY